MSSLLSFEHVFSARRLFDAHLAPSAHKIWRFESLQGRLVELSCDSAAASLTVAFGLIAQAQKSEEPVAWISAREGLFFPPDAERSGVDLRALPVIRLESAHAAGRVADRLLRSEAFGLVVLDLGQDTYIPTPLMGRLMRMAKAHQSVLLILTEKSADDASVNALVSLRVEAHRYHLGAGRYSCDVQVIKDKRSGRGQTYKEVCCGPAGLR